MNNRHPIRNFSIIATTLIVLFLAWMFIEGSANPESDLYGYGSAAVAIFGPFILGLIALGWIIYAIVQSVKRKQK